MAITATPNKHPYLDNKGKHVVGGPLTGWVFADVNRHTACPKCGSDPGYCCQTPKGKKAATPHNERLRAYASGPVPGAAGAAAKPKAKI